MKDQAVPGCQAEFASGTVVDQDLASGQSVGSGDPGDLWIGTEGSGTREIKLHHSDRGQRCILTRSLQGSSTSGGSQQTINRSDVRELDLRYNLFDARGLRGRYRDVDRPVLGPSGVCERRFDHVAHNQGRGDDRGPKERPTYDKDRLGPTTADVADSHGEQRSLPDGCDDERKEEEQSDAP